MMNSFRVRMIVFCWVFSVAGEPAKNLFAQPIELSDSSVQLVQRVCSGCHDENTETRFDAYQLSNDLSDLQNFRKWVWVFDQVEEGKMPPKSDGANWELAKKEFLDSLQKQLHESSLHRQKKMGRVATRRLTRTEFEYSLQDLLRIDAPLRGYLPLENQSGFDTVAARQRLSKYHLEALMNAVDYALSLAFVDSPDAKKRKYKIDYRASPYVKIWYDRPWKDGGDNLREVHDGVASFKRTDFIWRTDRNGFIAKHPGRYRIVADVYAYQARSPVTFSLYRASGAQSDQQEVRLLQAFDLKAGQSRKVSITAYLSSNEYVLPSFAQLDRQADGKSLFQTGAKKYTGEGIVIRSLEIEGPLYSPLPPASFQRVFKSTEPGSRNDLLPKVQSVLEAFMPRALRRPVKQGELKSFVSMARPVVTSRGTLKQAVSQSIKAVLTSPQFLFLDSKPGKLDEFSLASRLSYFLWKSVPDNELLQLASQGQLSSEKVLVGQVNRMLDNQKVDRFVSDFADQWLHLNEFDLTTPDRILYPEFNDYLRQAMLDETRMFLRDMIRNNAPIRHLIDSDYTFLNSELANHYGVPGVSGQQMRKVKLPTASPRGGLLGQAAIMKVTANGTTTSPVKRGLFVLQDLLGQEVPSPPKNIGSIEPDIRGVKSIKDSLAAHRNTEDCNRCHQHIDPPGFALECFDVIGGFRNRYRRLGKGGQRFEQGLDVDTSGTTHDGRDFHSLDEYRKMLLNDEMKERGLTRALVSKLLVYSTGGEIQFADRKVIEKIVSNSDPGRTGIRDLILSVITNPVFQNQ